MTKFTKFISVMLAVVLMVMAIPFTTFAATKGDVDGNGEISAVDARLILQVVAGLKKEADLKNAAGADVDGKNGVTAVDARVVLQIVAGLADAPTEPEKPQEPSGDSEKAQLAALFNAETAKAAKGTYKWTRSCGYVNNLTVSGIETSAIQSTVDKFLGIGATYGDKSNAGQNALIPMNIKESDIKEIQQTREQITLVLNNSENPTVGGDSAISHVTNDIVTQADVENEIKTAVPIAQLKNFRAYYYDVKVTAFLDNNGNPSGLLITYKLNAKLTATAMVKDVTGEGTVETKLEYTDFKY